MILLSYSKKFRISKKELKLRPPISPERVKGDLFTSQFFRRVSSQYMQSIRSIYQGNVRQGCSDALRVLRNFSAVAKTVSTDEVRQQIQSCRVDENERLLIVDWTSGGRTLQNYSLLLQITDYSLLYTITMNLI